MLSKDPLGQLVYKVTISSRPSVLGSSIVMHHSSSKGDEDAADTSLEEKVS